MTYLEKAQDLQRMIGEGKSMEALEKYYADHVVIVDDRQVREGKAAQRQAIEGWYQMVKEMHGSGSGAVTSDENQGITTAESWVDFTTQEGHRMRMEEVAVQKWEGDQIVHERFYYNPAPPEA